MDRFLPQLAQARARQDVAGVRHVVHTLKSSAASIGARRLSELCSDCDVRLREGVQLSQLVAELEGVGAEMLRVQQGVRALMPAGNAAARVRGA
jgi:HPt (histidine-containing phosphotransfer) domain-containing protein